MLSTSQPINMAPSLNQSGRYDVGKPFSLFAVKYDSFLFVSSSNSRFD